MSSASRLKEGAKTMRLMHRWSVLLCGVRRHVASFHQNNRVWRRCPYLLAAPGGLAQCARDRPCLLHRRAWRGYRHQSARREASRSPFEFVLSQLKYSRHLTKAILTLIDFVQ